MNKKKESIGKWISVLHRQFQIYINAELKNYDINSSEYIFLVNLYEKDGVNQEQLSSNLFINKAATTRAISRLERLGYVRRERDKRDKRAYNVSLTNRGLDAKDFIMQKLNYWTKTISSNFSEDETNEIIKKLKIMSEKAIMETRKNMLQKN